MADYVWLLCLKFVCWLGLQPRLYVGPAWRTALLRRLASLCKCWAFCYLY